MGEGNQAVVTMVEEEIQKIVRGSKRHAEETPELCSDVLKAGATSIAEITKLMSELQAARDYLHAEGQRVHRMAERYAHLTRTASASVKIISESMGKWRSPELGVIAQSNQAGNQAETGSGPALDETNRS